MAYFTPRAPASVTSRKTVVCPAQKKEVATTGKNAVLAVALSVGVAVSPMVAPAPVQANSYSDRVAAMEQRKKLLQEAKEQATGESNQSTPTGYDYLDSMKNALSMKIPDLPASSDVAEQEAPEPAAPPAFKGFSFSKPSAEVEAPAAPAPEEAPAPAIKPFTWNRPAPVEAPPAPKPFSFSRAAPEATPAPKEEAEVPEAPPAPKPFSFSRPSPPVTETPPPPAPFSFSRPAAPQTPEAPPAPKPEVKPEAPKPVVVEAKKAEQQQESTQSKKRKGPLPMALAQFLLLGAYIGGAYALLAKSTEIGKVADTISQAVTGLVKQASPKTE